MVAASGDDDGARNAGATWLLLWTALLASVAMLRKGGRGRAGDPADDAASVGVQGTASMGVADGE